VVDLTLIDALDALATSLAHVGSGGSKAAKEAAEFLAEYQERFGTVEELRRSAAALTGPKGPKAAELSFTDRSVAWQIAQSFPSLTPVQVAARVAAGEELCIAGGRAALRNPKTGATHVGGAV